MAKKRVAIDVLKGLLMLFVMLGHNKLLMSVTHASPILYTFHIPGFFFVAALLNRGVVTREKAMEKTFAYLYPHFIFFSLTTILFLSNYGREIEATFSGWLSSMFSGNGTMTKPYCGLQSLWYLPAIYSFYLIVGFYNGLHNTFARAALLCLPFILVVVLYMEGFPLARVPFGIPVALFMLPVAVLVRWLTDRYEDSPWLYGISLLIAGLMVVEVSTAKFNLAVLHLFREEQPLMLLVELLFMVSMFFLLMRLARRLEKNPLLAFIGRHSLEIYLVHHLFDVLLVDRIGPRIGLPTTDIGMFFTGLAGFCLVLILSLSVAYCSRISKLSYLFRLPRLATR